MIKNKYKQFILAISFIILLGIIWILNTSTPETTIIHKPKVVDIYQNKPVKSFNDEFNNSSQVSINRNKTQATLSIDEQKSTLTSNLSILDKSTERYGKYKELYKEEKFSIKAIGDNLVGAYSKDNDVDFIIIDLAFITNNLGNTQATHSYFLDELDENEQYGTWDNSLKDEFLDALSAYNSSDVLNVSDVNCREIRCVATLRFDNEREFSQLFQKLNQDAKYSFYAIPFYAVTSFEATLIIMRIDNA
ncbi:hypothetical protein [Colwellia sp. BRX10-4]|jgi:hypothetical protein|uniref:hypothetical protein n=1 Tax=Colwellia sp. BRX10-4 TaxID=2759843 RepID=UPI0015F5FCEB|nr:hypothetical protein [Colwellia sp. BRX10-4]MBA6397611.1 hypothetical protein [Colwellia sp. BRX10-4]